MSAGEKIFLQSGQREMSLLGLEKFARPISPVRAQEIFQTLGLLELGSAFKTKSGCCLFYFHKREHSARAPRVKNLITNGFPIFCGPVIYKGAFFQIPSAAARARSSFYIYSDAAQTFKGWPNPESAAVSKFLEISRGFTKTFTQKIRKSFWHLPWRGAALGLAGGRA